MSNDAPERQFEDSWRPEDKAMEAKEDEFFAAKYHENPDARHEAEHHKSELMGSVNKIVRRGRQMGF